ncbi:MAG TPA: hypothetical protein VE220_06785 [Gaiellaceae bacterium]|nr:hypothetical protein [Gaiellaceae bacterium]
MLLKILVVGALAIGLMATIRDGRVLRDSGLLSSCSSVTVHGQLDSTMQQCTKGRLDGFPDLTNKSCQLVAQGSKRDLWRCDVPIVSSQSPNG